MQGTREQVRSWEDLYNVHIINTERSDARYHISQMFADLRIKAEESV